jgi:hypothetical protein
VAQVDQRIAGDHCANPLAPQHEVELAFTAGIGLQPEQRVADRVARRRDELVLGAIRRRGPHGKAKRCGVALVPRGGEYRDHLARSEQRANVVRYGDRVDEDQQLAVVDCVRRDRAFPLGMRRRPVVHALGKHSRMLVTTDSSRPATLLDGARRGRSRTLSVVAGVPGHDGDESALAAEVTHSHRTRVPGASSRLLTRAPRPYGARPTFRVRAPRASAKTRKG